MCLDCMVIICRWRLFGCFDARFNYKRACCFRLARFDIVYRKTSLEQFDDLQHPLSPKIHYLAVTSTYLSRAAIVLVLSVAGGFFLCDITVATPSYPRRKPQETTILDLHRNPTRIYIALMAEQPSITSILAALGEF